MASLKEVTARIRAACSKGIQARVALEQVEDLTREAHDMVARALAGARCLEPDMAQVLAAFQRVVDGCKGHLWPLLNAAVKDAENIADRLSADNSAPRQPQPPSVRQPDSGNPPAVPVEQVERLRRELPPPVMPGTGQKTCGYLLGADGTAQPVVSGRDDDAAEADRRLRDMGMPRKSARTGDVEIKLAARMVRDGVRHATVLINNEPCAGPFGCDTLVPILLPEGATITVHGTTEQGEPIRKRYAGGARPWWR
ncbi:hypothetical protein JOF41_004905 [Saccharothrix coeruleofusca]|uniref:DddA-like double-stranded DNA deaminase toxin n=1 Tax=Saccharothrix coeruleofusca TaxID=33919 RepID=UPI001AE3C9A4|nr:DddA-like double-stranded DNA deaminase toxin [Saccharothrix coeruleofusca]MBP2338727.1 hypothetical protein [Saccharothrix coeruleofusca]